MSCLRRSVSHWLLRAEDLFRSKTIPCRLCDVQSSGRKEFLSEYRVFALSESFLHCSLHISYLSTTDTIPFIVCVISHNRVGQFQPTGGPHVSLRTRMGPALVSILNEGVCLFLAQQPSAGHGLLIHEVSRSHAATHHSR